MDIHTAMIKADYYIKIENDILTVSFVDPREYNMQWELGYLSDAFFDRVIPCGKMASNYIRQDIIKLICKELSYNYKLVINNVQDNSVLGKICQEISDFGFSADHKRLALEHGLILEVTDFINYKFGSKIRAKDI